jgi:DNA-binding transcriptional LysR family regulator
MNVNVRHLLTLNTVIKQGSVSGAARLLRVSQPSVTKTLHLIEQDLGVPLFARIKGRLHPTPEAMLLIGEVDRLSSVVEQIQDLAVQIREGRAGKLSIAAVSTLASSVVARTITVFQREWPGVTVENMAYSTREVVDEVAENRVDIGILDILPVRQPDCGIVELGAAPMVCVMPSNHPLAAKTVIEPADLMNQPVISFSESTTVGYAVRDAFRKVNPRFQFALTVNQTVVACALVQSGAGLALVDPFPVVSGIYRDLTARRFQPSVKLHPVILYRHDRPRSRLAISFEMHLRETFATLTASAADLFNA